MNEATNQSKNLENTTLRGEERYDILYIMNSKVASFNLFWFYAFNRTRGLRAF